MEKKILMSFSNVIIFITETNCHYEKSQWSPCDEKTNVKARTLTLKKGDETCEKTKKIEKKCKKGTIFIRDLYLSCNTI
jgi:pleiotrophin